MEIHTIKLCPCNNTGCPTVSKEGDRIKIVDDFGGEVTMTFEEALLIQDALDKLDISYKCP